MNKNVLLTAAALLLGAAAIGIGLSGCGHAPTEASRMSGSVGHSTDSFFDPSRTPPHSGSSRFGYNGFGDLYFDTSSGRMAREREMAAAMRAASPAGALPGLDEEVWVIVKDESAAASGSKEDDTPGCGGMVCRIGEGQSTRDVPLPLKHTEVRTAISAYIASVEVTQEFFNPYDSKIEAVYVFPLPHNAAVNGFVMVIGERKIRGIIREREEAQRIYDQAKSQGYVTSLLNQERPNIFTQHVANIEPGKQIDVNITYLHTLAYDDGWYEYVFPMVVGPRFNPPGFSEGVGAVGGGAYGASGQKTEIPYLRPNERSGHDIGVAVDIMAGVPIEEIICRSHKIEISHEASEQVRVTLDQQDRIPNKDFVLRYRVAGDQVKTAFLTHRNATSGEGYFTVMLFPPRELSVEQRQPMEMVFVLDCSRSMSGKPIEQAKAAIDHALTRLQPGDTFQIVNFSNSASRLGPQPIPATSQNIARGRQYVRSLNSEGGTMMIYGIQAALKFQHDPERLRVVAFLTDGYIGNEAEILAEVRRLVGPARIFSFGVGSSVNRYLLDSMAKLGRGAVAYLGLNDSGADVMDRYFTRVSHPVLTDIQIDWGGLQVKDVLPARTPDLFVGRPVILTGKFTGADATSIQVRGRAGRETVQAALQIDPASPAASHAALPSVWARMFIAECMDQAVWDANIELPQQVKSIALQYGLMSAYTSFVAVDSSRRTEGDHGTTVHVAVPVPEGVKYLTTVQER